MLKRKSPTLSVCLLAFSFLSAGSVSLSQQTNKDVMGSLRYRYIGPVGNRLTSVVGVPGQANIYYVGAASGGIWKTTDGGTHWDPVFDDQVVSSIGSLAVAPSDPNIIWAGTGEPWILGQRFAELDLFWPLERREVLVAVRADVIGRQVVLALDLLEVHSARQAADDNDVGTAVFRNGMSHLFQHGAWGYQSQIGAAVHDV